MKRSQTQSHTPAWSGRSGLAGIVLLAGLAGMMAGCSSQPPAGDLEQLNTRLSEQETKLTRLTQTVSANETQQRYLAGQDESLGGTGDMGELGKAEVRFAFNSYDLSAEARQSLDALERQMRDNPGAVIEIRGHTDAVGSREYNFQLGELRAEAVARYLHKRFSIPLYRMTRMSFGEEELSSGAPANARDASSRRVDVRVLGRSMASSSGEQLP